MTAEKNPEKHLAGAPLLRDILAEATFRPGRVVPDELQEVDLGIFSDEALVLANECFNQPDNADVARIVYVTGAKKILVQKTIFRSFTRGFLPMVAETSIVPKAQAESTSSNDRYLGMILFTSTNTNQPFSAQPLAMLLVADSDPFALTAAFIAGRSQNMLIMRGENASQLTRGEATKKRNLWTWQLTDRINQFTETGMNQDVVMAIQERAQRALLKQICEKYGLVYFAGESDSSIVTRQSPQKLQAE